MDKSYNYGRFACAAMVAALVMVTSGAAIAQTTYGVFCANGRIEIELAVGRRNAPAAWRLSVRPLSLPHGRRKLRAQEFQDDRRPLQLPLARLSVAVSAA